MRDLGYIEGKNIAFEFRWAETIDQLPALAAELVRMNVDVIFASTSTESEAAAQATKTIPIVFATHADPVGVGHVKSLARPGGNITGLTMLLTDLVAKEMEILKEALPQATRIGVIFSSTAPSHIPALQAIETAAAKLGVRIEAVPVREVEDLEGAFATMDRARVDGFLVVSSSRTFSARASGGPCTEAPSARNVRHQGQRRCGRFMSYAPDLDDLTRRSAIYIDKIFRGAKAADLPVEQDTSWSPISRLPRRSG